VRISWTQWFTGFAPIGATLLVLTPVVLYVIYPPTIRTAPEVPRWAADELRAMGSMSRREVILFVLVGSALALWIAAADYIDPAVTAIIIVLLMVISGVVSWDDVVGQKQAWNVLIWFGTLVTLAGGLAETGFVGWLSKAMAPTFTSLSLGVAIVAIVGTFFVLHYFFASITRAHRDAVARVPRRGDHHQGPLTHTLVAAPRLSARADGRADVLRVRAERDLLRQWIHQSSRLLGARPGDGRNVHRRLSAPDHTLAPVPWVLSPRSPKRNAWRPLIWCEEPQSLGSSW
jgi:hypothetical protein